MGKKHKKKDGVKQDVTIASNAVCNPSKVEKNFLEQIKELQWESFLKYIEQKFKKSGILKCDEDPDDGITNYINIDFPQVINACKQIAKDSGESFKQMYTSLEKDTGDVSVICQKYFDKCCSHFSEHAQAILLLEKPEGIKFAPGAVELYGLENPEKGSVLSSKFSEHTEIKENIPKLLRLYSLVILKKPIFFQMTIDKFHLLSIDRSIIVNCISNYIKDGNILFDSSTFKEAQENEKEFKTIIAQLSDIDTVLSNVNNLMSSISGNKKNKFCKGSNQTNDDKSYSEKFSDLIYRTKDLVSLINGEMISQPKATAPNEKAKENKQLQKKIKDLEVEYNKIKEELHDTKTQLCNSTDNNKELKNTIEKNEQEIEEKKKKIETMTDHLNNLSAHSEQQQSLLKEKEQNYLVINQAKQSLTEKCQALEKQIQSLQNNLKEQGGNVEGLKGLKQQNHELQSVVTKNEQEIKEKKQVIKGLEDCLHPGYDLPQEMEQSACAANNINVERPINALQILSNILSEILKSQSFNQQHNIQIQEALEYLKNMPYIISPLEQPTIGNQAMYYGQNAAGYLPDGSFGPYQVPVGLPSTQCNEIVYIVNSGQSPSPNIPHG